MPPDVNHRILDVAFGIRDDESDDERRLSYSAPSHFARWLAFLFWGTPSETHQVFIQTNQKNREWVAVLKNETNPWTLSLELLNRLIKKAKLLGSKPSRDETDQPKGRGLTVFEMCKDGLLAHHRIESEQAPVLLDIGVKELARKLGVAPSGVTAFFKKAFPFEGRKSGHSLYKALCDEAMSNDEGKRLLIRHLWRLVDPQVTLKGALVHYIDRVSDSAQKKDGERKSMPKKDSDDE